VGRHRPETKGWCGPERSDYTARRIPPARKVLHSFRNEVYHIGVHHHAVLPVLSSFYLKTACDFLGGYNRSGWVGAQVKSCRIAQKNTSRTRRSPARVRNMRQRARPSARAPAISPPTRDPVTAWRQRTQAVRHEPSPHKALHKYRSSMDQTEALRDSINEASAGIQAYLDQQLDHWRGR
jgi:hypothetical protein